jgi:hypothetical protein
MRLSRASHGVRVDTTTPTQTTSPLEYAPPEHGLRRVLTVRRIILVLVLSLLPLLTQPVVRLANHFQSLRAQNAVMAYASSPAQVVYEEDSARAAALAAWGQGYVRRGIAACLRPPEWERFGLQYAACPAFLHARRAPGGAEWIVTVNLAERQTTAEPVLLFHVDAVRPATLLRGVNGRAAGPQYYSVFLGPTDRARVYAGQPDALDATHFTIDVEVNGRRTTLDGWLADGGTVTLTPRAGRERVPGTWEPPGSTWADRFK